MDLWPYFRFKAMTAIGTRRTYRFPFSWTFSPLPGILRRNFSLSFWHRTDTKITVAVLLLRSLRLLHASRELYYVRGGSLCNGVKRDIKEELLFSMEEQTIKEAYFVSLLEYTFERGAECCSDVICGSLHERLGVN